LSLSYVQLHSINPCNGCELDFWLFQHQLVMYCALVYSDPSIHGSMYSASQPLIVMLSISGPAGDGPRSGICSVAAIVHPLPHRTHPHRHLHRHHLLHIWVRFITLAIT
jgi:hypothetical protein